MPAGTLNAIYLGAGQQNGGWVDVDDVDPSGLADPFTFSICTPFMTTGLQIDVRMEKNDIFDSTYGVNHSFTP